MQHLRLRREPRRPFLLHQLQLWDLLHLPGRDAPVQANPGCHQQGRDVYEVSRRPRPCRRFCLHTGEVFLTQTRDHWKAPDTGVRASRLSLPHHAGQYLDRHELLAKKKILPQERRAVSNEMTRRWMASVSYPHVADMGTEVCRVKKFISQASELAVNGRSTLSLSHLIHIQPLCTIPVQNVPVHVSGVYFRPNQTDAPETCVCSKFSWLVLCRRTFFGDRNVIHLPCPVQWPVAAHGCGALEMWLMPLRNRIFISS